MAKLCTACGYGNENTARYCANCGSPVAPLQTRREASKEAGFLATSRRVLLRRLTVATLSSVLASIAGWGVWSSVRDPANGGGADGVPVETRVVIRELIKEVPVERIITRDVIKEVLVEKIITQEVIREVIKEVPAEVVEEKVVTNAPTREPVTVPAATTIPSGPISGGTLTLSASRANAEDIFSPFRQVSSTQAFVNDYVFMPLWYGDTWGSGETPSLAGEWAPGVANRWDEVEKGRVYNFHINPDVRWHDGAALTVDDVLFGMEMAFDRGYNTPGGFDWGQINGARTWGENATDSAADIPGVTVVDDMTIQIALEAPNADWWAAGAKVFPMARHHYAGFTKVLATEARATDPLGNGPMVWQRLVAPLFADMSPNPNFAYGAPYVDRYVVLYGDGDELDALMEANEQPDPIDFHRPAGGVEAFQRLASLPHVRAVPQRSPFGIGIYLNQTAEIFEDMTLEQQSLLIEAMVLAVDREAINANLYGGTRFNSDYIFEHVASMQDPPEGTFRDLSYDPGLAREVLAESEWDTESVIKWIKWGPMTPADLAVQDYWEAIGVKTEILRIEPSEIIEKLYQGRIHDMVLANMGGGQGPIEACLRICSDRLYDLGGFNHSNTDRPWIDEGFAEVFAAGSDAERRERWLALARRLHAKGEMVYGLLMRGSLLNLYHRRVKGAFWMQHFSLPVRSPINQVWLDPYWNQREA